MTISTDFLRELYRHLAWADWMVWEAIESSGKNLADDYLHKTLFHLHATQRAFMNFWTGLEMERMDYGHFADLTEIRNWSEAFYSDVDVFLATLEDTDLDQTAVVPWVRYFERHINREAQPTRLSETLFQVTVHSAYHRGQVNRRLRELGVEPPLVDYIAWIWLGRPSASRTEVSDID